uniref:Uncharacterized protein n=1 Tax=Trichuris muris TaxID=70415 RepID=A0A5S6QRU8_TRIMR
MNFRELNEHIASRVERELECFGLECKPHERVSIMSVLVLSFSTMSQREEMGSADAAGEPSLDCWLRYRQVCTALHQMCTEFPSRNRLPQG